jgi:cyclophilin family peptidyl-prolyl cis-trans isomerase
VAQSRQREKRQRQKQGRHARQAAVLAAQRRRSRRIRIFVAGFLALVLVLSVAALTGGGSSSKKVTSASPSTTGAPGAVNVPTVPEGASLSGATPCPKADGSSPRTTKFAKPPAMCISPDRTYTAEVKTNKGTFTVALDAKQAPQTVNNFVVLARYHYYDGISFHRIIPGFVVQGGDPTGTGQGNPGYKFADELPKPGQYKIGSLAMANSGPNTNGSQFFIITGDQGVSLPPQYSLFGQVTQGMDVVKEIESAGSPAAAGDQAGKPTAVVTMQSVTITET